MKKNILIVGASGSRGHEFTKHYDLERNVEKIFALSRRNKDFDSKKIHPVIFDYNKDGLLDLFLLTQPPNPGGYSMFSGTELLKPEYHLKLFKNKFVTFSQV
mgnify:CR=1 FL=1